MNNLNWWVVEKMLLAIDVGNTHIVMGLYKGEKLIKDWRISTNRQKTADEWIVDIGGLFYYSKITWEEIFAIIISSVVPNLTNELKKMATEYIGIEPIVVNYELDTGLKIKLDKPEEIGADRIVNAVAAYEKFADKGNIIVADFGTATTYDAINSKGEYLGGAIAPGIGISVEALFSYAAKLPRVELTKPPGVIGRNTVESMQSGIIYGFASQVDGMVTKMKAELGGQAIVLATGGLAPLIGPECSTVDRVDKYLTLEGLRIIHSKITREGK
jgi:type III pantothenate kinase